MKEKPSTKQIAEYINWLKEPEGDAHLQQELPLTPRVDPGKAADSASDHPSQIMLNRQVRCGPQSGKMAHSASEARRRENANLSESDGKARIRCLAIAGKSIQEIATRTGCHPDYVKTVIHAPGRVDRRYSE